MNCPNCNNENPEGAIFCKSCGSKLSQNIVCPVCGKECSEKMHYCPSCGSSLDGSPSVAENAEETAQKAPEKSGKMKKTLQLVSGIFMMVSMLFALVFCFFIGTTQRADSGYSETYSVWHFFGRAYALLQGTSAGANSYAAAAHYIPVVLSTVIAAGTLVSVVVLSMIATVNFGLHFKRDNVRYYKYAVAAVFTFLLGATLFDCIHSVSTESYYGTLSGTTVTGMVFACLFLIASLILKIIAIGKDFRKKEVLVDCISTLAGILCLSFLAGFAKAEQANFSIEGRYLSHTYSINFFRINNELSFIPSASVFTLSVCISIAQIALIVLTLVALIMHIGNFTEKRNFSFWVAVALTAVSAVHLALCAISVEVVNGINSSLPELRLSASPILAFVASVLYLAASITNKVLEKKTQESE